MFIQFELDQLPLSKCLLTKNTWKLYFVSADEAPLAIKHLQQLRADTFAIKPSAALDLYNFYDPYHHHLLLWDTAEQTLVGAYRVGFVQEIINTHGIDKLYAAGAFPVTADFFNAYPGTLELSGAFVQTAYQKNYYALLTLWKGLIQIATQQVYAASFLGQIYFSLPSAPIRACLADFFTDPAFHLLAPANSLCESLCAKNLNRELYLNLIKALEAINYDFRADPNLIMLKHYLAFPVKCLMQADKSIFGPAYNALLFSETMNTQAGTAPTSYLENERVQKLARA